MIQELLYKKEKNSGFQIKISVQDIAYILECIYWKIKNKLYLKIRHTRGNQ